MPGGRIVYTVPAGTFLGRRNSGKARPGTVIDGEVIRASVDTRVDIDLDEQALCRLAVRAVRNLAGRAVSGPATARARKATS
ncbi:MAG: hypothetical protein AB7S57_19665 [Acetobacteraceae bacterium]